MHVSMHICMYIIYIYKHTYLHVCMYISMQHVEYAALRIQEPSEGVNPWG